MLEYGNIYNTNSTVSEKLHLSETQQIIFTSSKVETILQWIIFATLPQIIIVCGIAGNIINIICFVKQGFKDTVNVTFVGLAITDFGCLSTLIWTNICCTPAFYALDLPFQPLEIQFMTSGLPHAMFSRISSWITALITFERCLCIAMPLKVKDIVTAKRLCIITILIFVVLILSVCPVYFVYNLGNKFYPERNKTLLGIVYVGDRESFDPPFYSINFFVPLCAFVVITVCTIILVVELKDKAKWRQTSTLSSDNLTSSNKRVAKMVVMVSTLYIVCFTPIGIMSVAMATIPELSIDGEYRNILTIIGGTGFLLETVNSSSNFIIYFHMSSKFREAFFRIFAKCGINSSGKQVYPNMS